MTRLSQEEPAMPIAIKPIKSNHVRAIKELSPYLSPEDIAAVTKISLYEVRSALSRRPAGDKPKSRAQ